MGAEKEKEGRKMNKFFDDLCMELPLKRIRELGAYIVRFVGALGGDIPVEGRLGNVSFCATALPGEQVRVHWVQVGRERIAVDATI
jgi:hypothetical protein